MDEQEIIRLYQKRDETAIRLTQERFGGLIRHVAQRILGDPQDAEECVNDAYLAVWNSIPPQQPDSLLAYTGRITRNLAINRYHQKSALKRGGGLVETALEELAECLPGSMNVEEELEGRWLTECIEHFLDRQKPIKRQLFVRRYWYLESVSELTERFRLSENRVSVELYRMREKLRTYLINEGVSL
ncbi:MAG: sigma-70 family RNA polymerase sigma factor [Lachnospiraceae bacterium]|nr:sigma-70 family RNA polymerase sigma factor [Lachnospiraceae bacterium]MDY5741795.1 sigma-70 family RNA polymerase sigma factor [Lachnospiraceae bacterium]